MAQRRQQPCSIPNCGKESIPGLKRGHGKCQYHWNAGVWGKEWADRCERENEARQQQLPAQSN